MHRISNLYACGLGQLHSSWTYNRSLKVPMLDHNDPILVWYGIVYQCISHHQHSSTNSSSPCCVLPIDEGQELAVRPRSILCCRMALCWMKLWLCNGFYKPTVVITCYNYDYDYNQLITGKAWQHSHMCFQATPDTANLYQSAELLHVFCYFGMNHWWVCSYPAEIDIDIHLISVHISQSLASYRVLSRKASPWKAPAALIARPVP